MRKIIIANWKMNLSPAASAELAHDLAKVLSNDALERKDVVLAPSVSALTLVAEEIKKEEMALSAQDIFWEDRGAFTGCESPEFLREAGCRYAIVGHSERRQNLAETDEMIHLKLKAALSAGLTPILCVGETYEERREGQTGNVLLRQVNSALQGINFLTDEYLVVAYEPVWVIGSGQAIEPAQAEEAFRIIWQQIIDNIPMAVAKSNVRIIYGGSVDSSNAEDFVPLDHFAGFLVGGASLKAEELVKVIELT
ncbi:MAG: triose-phosphate isomerase [Patescibacteria group bacterium]|jgi:triosephosphate isomerase